MQLFAHKIKTFLLELGGGRRRYVLGLAALAAVLGVVAAPTAWAAAIEDVVYTVIGYIAVAIVWFVGRLIVVVIGVLITVAQYNGFIDAAPVREGWLILVGFCNMFFILLLLIMAFGTVLGVSKYSFRSLLPKVVIAAILINFSKLICGVIIDFSQVIMLTFVAGFKDIGAGNFTQLLGIDQLLKINADGVQSNMPFLSIIGSYLLAIIYSLVVLVVLLTILATLVIRIVYLWILVIISPLTFFASAVPGNTGLGKVTSSWWGRFTSHLVVGPMMAFFLWLSLATLGSFTSDQNSEFIDKIGMPQPQDEAGAGQQLAYTTPTVGVTEVGTPEHLMRFIISLGLLIGGLATAKSFGGEAGGAAAWGVAKIKRGSTWMQRQAKRPVSWAAKKSKAAAVAAGAKTMEISGGLAKAVDYKLTGGSVGRAASETKRMLFTGEGYREMFEAGLRGRPFKMETNRAINKARLEATVKGEYKDAKGVAYKYDAARDRFVDEKNPDNVAKVNGVELTAMKDPGLYSAYHGSRRVLERETKTAITPAEKRVRDWMDKAKGMSQEELISAFRAESLPDRKKAYALLAADKDAIPYKHIDFIRQAEDLLKNDNKLMAEFVDKRKKTSAYDVYDFDNEAERAAFVGEAKKGKIKLSEQKLDKNVDDQKLGTMLQSYLEAVGSEKFRGEIGKMDREASKSQLEKLSEGLMVAANGVFQKVAKERYDSLKTANPNWSEAQLSGAAVEQAFSDRQHSDLRGHAVVMGNDLTKAFSNAKLKVDLTSNSLGNLAAAINDKHEYRQLNTYANNASARDLLNIDAAKLQDKHLEILAKNMNWNKLKAMEKDGSNMELVDNIMKKMAEQNHVDADKIPTVNNNIKIDYDAVDHNRAISYMFKREDKDANDYETMNKFRQALESQQRSDDFFKVDKKGRPTKESYAAMKQAFQQFERQANANPGAARQT